MLQLSVSLGRWFGVHVRMHLSLLLLLALAAGYSAVATSSLQRGVALWFALCAAILVREIARAIAAAYAGLSLRALLLLPIGGVMALAAQPGAATSKVTAPQPNTRILSLVGSLANFAVALLLLGLAYGVDPKVRLVSQPWITLEHLLRSAIWLQVAIGAVNLLPTAALPVGRFTRASAAPTSPPAEDSASAPTGLAGRPPIRSLFGLFTAFALAMVLAGIVAGLLWPVLLGLTMLFTSYVTRASGAVSAEAMTVNVREVMLTEVKPLNAATTLQDALRETTHSTQELFPVLRGERLVGWISRTGLAAHLRTEGNGFLQGAMSRSVHTASPGEKLGEALRRATSLGAGEFIPVVEDGAMIGLLTPASLERAVGQLRQARIGASRETS